MVVSYNGSVGDYPIITSHIMTATTESVLDSVLVTGLVKNEPEDLTGGGVATVNNNRRPSASDHDIHSR